MKPVVFHDDARQELDEAMAWYENRLEGLGLDLQRDVERIVKLVRRHPQIGARYKQTSARFMKLKRFPYVLYYRKLETTIWVAAVANGSRRPGYWRSRSPG